MKKLLGTVLKIIGSLFLISIPLTAYHYFTTTTTGFLSVHMIGALLGYAIFALTGLGLVVMGNRLSP
ncbi:hypothetical protein [Spirosoma gilvum]